MALTGIQIFKLLPKTNCGECRFPTCLAFAMALAAGKAELDTCPYVSEDAREILSEASAPPIREVQIGLGDYRLKIGGEQVMFRHEKTFFNQPGIGVLITDDMDDDEVARRFLSLKSLQYERVGVRLKAELVALKDTGNKERFIAIVKRAAAEPYSVILMSFNPEAMKEALELLKGKRPIIYAATKANLELYAGLSKEYNCPLAVLGNGIEEVSSLTERLMALGLKDLIIDTATRTIMEGFQEQVIIRRAAILNKFKPLGFPTITFPCDMADNLIKESLIASIFIAKYAGIIILKDLQGEMLFPLLLQRLNIYTDPQRPMTTQEGIYPINNPDENSPVLVTCNFSLTYFIVSGEIESSRVPSWLCIMDTEGLSVMTAWAAGKFVGDTVAAFIKRCSIGDKVAHKRLIIPGYAAAILGDLEDGLPGWEVMIGPREAANIPSYLRILKQQ